MTDLTAGPRWSLYPGPQGWRTKQIQVPLPRTSPPAVSIGTSGSTPAPPACGGVPGNMLHQSLISSKWRASKPRQLARGGVGVPTTQGQEAPVAEGEGAQPHAPPVSAAAVPTPMCGVAPPTEARQRVAPLAPSVWHKPVTVVQVQTLSRTPLVWASLMRETATRFLAEHDSVHHGLPGFEAVPQCPSPAGHCNVLASPTTPQSVELADRLCEYVGGVLDMLAVHLRELSPAALDSSVTYISLPLLVDRITGEEMVAAFFLDGLLPRPECGGPCPVDWLYRHHDVDGLGSPMMPPDSPGRGHTYHAWLVVTLNKEWRTLTARPSFELGSVLTLLLRFAMAGAMAFTRHQAWPRAWGGAWGGNVHATKWLHHSVKRALQLDINLEEEARANFAGYGDCPSLSVRGKVLFRVRDGAGKVAQQAVNAHQLQGWLHECAKRGRAHGDDPVEWNYCRARLRVATATAWVRMLGALHPDTIIVADHTSWWAQSQWWVCFEGEEVAKEHCGVRRNPRDESAPKEWENPLLARSHSMLLHFQETRGKERGNAGKPLALLRCHSVPLGRNDDGAAPVDLQRPVLCMQLLDGQQGADGHMVGNVGNTWHAGLTDLRQQVARSMRAMGSSWGGAVLCPLHPVPSTWGATACVRARHQKHASLVGVSTATMQVHHDALEAPPPARRDGGTKRKLLAWAEDSPRTGLRSCVEGAHSGIQTRTAARRGGVGA